MKQLPNLFPVLLGGIFLCGSAQAATGAVFCLPFASLRMNVQNCDDNFAVGKKADDCLSLYTNALNAGRLQIDKNLKAEAAKGSSQQNTTFNTTNAVLERTVSELDRLIANGESAKLAVQTYSANLSLPEDYDQPQTTGMSTAQYLAVEPCFATPNRIINENSAVLELMVDDLKKAKSEVLAKSSSALTTGSQMGSGISSGTFKGNAPAGAGSPLPKRTFQEKDSDVTGIKEEKK